MNLIRVGPNLLSAKGVLLAFSQGAAITPPLADTGAPPTANLAGWWDASSLASIGIGAWGAVSSVQDRSGGGKPATTSSVAKPRQAGLFGGLFGFSDYNNYAALHPYINATTITASNIAVGAGQALTVYLTWSRALQSQNGPMQAGATLTTDPSVLLSVNGTSVLGMTGRGDGADTLTLFPAGAPVQAGALELRHTHSARIVFSGSTVDVWLDGAKVISAAASQITLGTTATLGLLPNSQLIFHEACVWSAALSVSDHTALTSYVAAKWPLGRRRAANGLYIGQSNAGYFTSQGYYRIVNQMVSYLTGCISSNLLWGPGGNISGTPTFSGQGLYDTTGTLILNSAGGGDPSLWPLGANGSTYMAMIDGLSADLKADVRYLAWYWSESDSQMLTYGKKAEYLAAMKNAFARIRGRIGMTAAQLPILVINALPFPTDVGCQTHREVMADLVADASQNCHFMLPQTDDLIGDQDSWDATTGAESGPGNPAHRNIAYLATYAYRMAVPIARAVVAAHAASNTPDAISAIDASIPQASGPKIASAHYEGTAYAATGSVLVTVTHDGGNDLILPLRAALGVGWTLMDGVSDTVAGNPGAPGALIKATACARVSATQLRVTLASAPAHPAKAQMYYVYGSGLDASGYAVIGSGNAVTDNFASVALAAGWQIGADMSAANQPNNPLQATTYGIPLTGG